MHRHMFEVVKAGKLSRLEALPRVTDAPVWETDSRGNTLLHHAVQSCDLRLVEEVLRMSRNPMQHMDKPNNQGYTPLHVASTLQKDEIINLLVETGANPNAVDLSGCTPLHFLATSPCERSVELLLEHGADANAEDQTGGTPLHMASSTGNSFIVNMLLRAGADINAQESSGLTPLHIAALCGVQNIAMLLVAKGANLELKDIEQETPLSAAGDMEPALIAVASTSGTHTELTSYLERRLDGLDGRTEQLFQAARYGWLDYFLYLESGQDDQLLTRVDAQGKSLLHNAVESGSAELVHYILSEGGQSKINCTSDDGWSPLHTAVHASNEEIVKMLVDSGADVHRPNRAGCTPMHYAPRGRSCLGIMKLLLSKGAQVNAKDILHGTPLHKAAGYGSKNATIFLIANGADPNAQDSAGLSPLHLAAICRYKDVAMHMILRGASLQAEDVNGKTPYTLAPEEWYMDMQASDLCFRRKPYPRRHRLSGDGVSKRPTASTLSRDMRKQSEQTN